MTPVRRQSFTLLILLSVALAFAADPAPRKVTDQKLIKTEDILAEFDGGQITRQDLETKISKVPANAQGRFKTVEGQTQVLDVMAVEEAFYAKAKQMKVEADPEVKEKIDAGTRQFLIQEYYKRNVTDLLVVTEADKQKYYDDNKAAFYLFPYLAISYIQAEDEASAQKALKELRAGKPFAEVSDRYNINTYAKGLKGSIKNIRLNGNIPGVGNDLELEKLVNDAVADSTVFNGPYKTATGWHVFRKNEHVPGRQKDFAEVLPELEQRTRPGVENRMLNELTDRLKLKYKVVVDTTRVAEISLDNPAKNEGLEAVNLVTASDPGVNINVKALVDSYAKLSPQEQMFITKGQGVRQLLDQELMRTLMHVDAKNQNYQQYLADNADYQQMQRYYVLNSAFRKLVTDTVTVTTEDSRVYYDAHLADFTTPANRSIQVLWFDSAKAAAKALKKYQGYVKKNSDKKIAALIEKSSTKPKQAQIDNIYNNGVITGIGPDKPFCDMVWQNPVGYISPVFKSARGEHVFFRTLAEKDAVVQGFTETEPRIYGTIKKQKETARQEEVTQQLFTEFNMKNYPARLTLKLSSEELFNLADSSARQRNFNDAITYYDQIIKNFPNGSDDSRALFMKAFTVAEDLKNEPLAIQLFTEFLAKFPTNDLSESAQFMLDTLQGKTTFDIED